MGYNVNELYPSKYLSASDLQGREVVVTISHVEIEEVGKEQERKPVLYFQGKQKGVALNKTNANNIAVLYGPNTDSWIGQPVELFVVWTDFNGKSVEAIRIRAPQRRGASQQSAHPNAPAAAQTRPATQQEPATNYAERREFTQDLEDEIPF